MMKILLQCHDHDVTLDAVRRISPGTSLTVPALTHQAGDAEGVWSIDLRHEFECPADTVAFDGHDCAGSWRTVVLP